MVQNTVKANNLNRTFNNITSLMPRFCAISANQGPVTAKAKTKTVNAVLISAGSAFKALVRTSWYSVKVFSPNAPMPKAMQQYANEHDLFYVWNTNIKA